MAVGGFRHIDRAWTVTAIGLLGCAGLEVRVLLDRSRGEPRNHGVRRFVLGEIYEGNRVEQRFVVKSNGLSSVRFYPRPASGSPTGHVLLDLRDVTGGRDWGTVRQESAPTAELAESRSYTMRFPPQPSQYREYALVVVVAGGSDGQGIGLLASRGGNIRESNYRRPTLLIDGRRQFGNLIFDTTVNEATSNFGAIASQMRQGGIPVPHFLLALILLVKYLALLLVIRAFAPVDRPKTGLDSTNVPAAL